MRLSVRNIRLRARQRVHTWWVVAQHYVCTQQMNRTLLYVYLKKDASTLRSTPLLGTASDLAAARTTGSFRIRAAWR